MSSASETGTPITTRSTLPPLAEGEADAAPSHRRPSASRRRDKPQLSCNRCRRRKSRCDRQRPCANCSSSGQTCTYAEDHMAASLPRSQPSQPSQPAAATAAAVPSLHDRLVQLERLVKSLMPDSARKPIAGPPTDWGMAVGPGLATDANRIVPADGAPVDTPMDERSECGSMRMTASELRYVGGEHWAAILDSIADLRDHFDREELLRLANSPHGNNDGDGDAAATPFAKTLSPHALLLYQRCRPASRSEILAVLPPKPAVDRYISRYFNRLDLVASSAVHGPSFLREYEAFWTDPSGVPIIWIGLLFSMICLAVMASDTAESYNSDEADRHGVQIDLYREKIVQCLIAGEYTKSGPYVLETVIHYVYIEFGTRADADKDIWFLLALEVNLAMRMGYHRDPSHFPGMTPLQSEMRRRLWATVLLGDILISSQMGMPRMISDWQCDTSEPRNLNDDDLDENTTELPPARPETEHTTVLGVIARRRMLVALGIIADLTAAVEPCSYNEVMRVDAILHKAAANIPLPLKMKPMAASVTDSPQVIMARLFIVHIFYKGQIMLHRRFLYTDSSSRDEDTFAYSRKACLDASLSTLQIQQVLDEETCPGGQLHMMRWRVSSIMNHQFLTATMILCSLLHRGQTLDREEEILAALRRSRTIWMRRSAGSLEAKKAAETVSIVLARVGEGRGYDFELDDEDGGGMAMEGSSLPPSTNMHSATEGSDEGLGIEGQKLLQDVVGFNESDRFVMPALLGMFTPPDQQYQNFSFNSNVMERGSVPDEWMTMNGSGQNWW